MTTDAKIGLLLGLVFIFVIALIINGLPSFHEDKNNNELTTNLVGLQNNPPGIGTKEREVIHRIKPAKEQPVKVQVPPTDEQNVRFRTPLPTRRSAGKTANEPETTSSTAAVEKKNIRKDKPNESTLPTIYVVVEDDNLLSGSKNHNTPADRSGPKQNCRYIRRPHAPEG